MLRLVGFGLVKRRQTMHFRPTILQSKRVGALYPSITALRYLSNLASMPTTGAGNPILPLSSDDVCIYLDYDMTSPPPVPDEGEWTRFVCLIDTHSRRFDVPSGDVLLHSGDLTAQGKVTDFQ